MKYICALIVVNNIKQSRFFYEELLGQKVKADFGENVTFHGDFSIHQKAHYRTLINNVSVKEKSHNFELYFEEDDLETVVETLKQNDIEFLHDIIEQPWKQKVVRFYDYDNHIIEIGERLEHVAHRLSIEGFTIEEISKITYLPKEVVQKAIEEYSE